MSSKNVTLKNTKQEIFDALNDAMEELKRAKENNFNPVETAKVKENATIVKSAKESVQENLFSEELSKKFTELNQAIEIKRAELKEVYGVEEELQNITAIINASKEFAAKSDADKASLQVEYSKLESDLRSHYDKLRDELNDDYNEYDKSLKKNREREKEEYEYTLKRTRAKEDDAWKDEKAKREAKIAELEATAREMYADAESKVDHIAELEAKVNEIPELIEAAKVEGAETAAKEAAREYGYKKTMTEKEHSYEVQRLNDKIESLTAELIKANANNEDLRQKLDKSYEQIRELATKTVESTGGVKILGNSDNGIRK